MLNASIGDIKEGNVRVRILPNDLSHSWKYSGMTGVVKYLVGYNCSKVLIDKKFHDRLGTFRVDPILDNYNLKVLSNKNVMDTE